jgi:hypothetical protein
MAMTRRLANLGGVAAVIFTILGSIALSFWIAVKTFWWCPEGGCSLAPASAKLAFLTNVTGLLLLLILFWVALWFVSAALYSLVFPRSVTGQVFLPAHVSLPAWYKNSMQRWLSMFGA